MAVEFDPGYGDGPFQSLVQDYAGTDVYPQDSFRSEWRPVFHRGRLDGTSRVLVIGQDPAQHETFIRRILVGEAGERTQGFLAKLGVDRSYTLINTFLYSVSGSATKHVGDDKIVAYARPRPRSPNSAIAFRIDSTIAIARSSTAESGD